MDRRRRLSRGLTATDSINNKLKLDSISKILKINSVNKDKDQKREARSKQVSRIALAELIKNSPSLSKPKPPEFRTFLSREKNLKVFREFLESQFCQENIDFYLACEKYRRLDPQTVGPDMVRFMATQIYNDFLASTAKFPINVSNHFSETIKKQLKNPIPSLFSAVQAEVFELMRTDCYPRFCKTWQLDKNLATEILTEDKQPDTDLSNVESQTTLNSTSHSILLNGSRTTHTYMRDAPSIKPSVRLDRSTCSSRSSCSRKKPSTSRHDSIIESSAIGQSRKRKLDENSNALEAIDLKKIHVVPNLKPLPPPPKPPRPTAPKPDLFIDGLCVTRQARPFVGKVYEV